MARKSKKERAEKKGSKKKKVGFTLPAMGKVAGTIVIPAGVHRAKIIDVESGEGDAGDYFKWTFEIIKGKAKGAKPKPYFTSLAENAIWNLKNLLVAIGSELADSDEEIEEFDPSDLIGEECDISIDHETYEGRKQSVIVGFGGEDDDEAEEEEEEEDEKPKGKKGKAAKKGGKKKKDEEEEEEEEEEEADDDEPSEEAIMEMTEEELEDFITDNDLEVDLDDFRVISKKRKAVVKAAKKKKLI